MKENGKEKRQRKRKGSFSVRFEILSVFLIFTCVIMAVSMAIHYDSIDEIRSMDIEHLYESGRQAAFTADEIIKDAGVLFDIQYSDAKIRNILLSPRKNHDEITRFRNTTYVENTISHALSNGSYIVRGCIFTKYGDVYSDISSVFADYRGYIQEIIDSGKVGRSIYYTGPQVWSIGQVKRKVVTAIKTLYDYNGTSPIAYITMDIDYEKLENLLKSASTSSGTILYCGGRTIYSDRVQGMSRMQEEEIQKAGVAMAENKKEQDIIQIGDTNYLTTAIRTSNSGWIIIRYISEKEALWDVTRRQRRDITILIITALMVFLIYYYRISGMMKPLSRMNQVIQSNKGDKLRKVYAPDGGEWKLGNNEIGNVVRNYNTMVDRINDYAERTLRNELIQKEAQIKMLTYQVNPHFLYNTLNTISAMAEIENMADIVKITDSISNIFRYNLKGETQVFLREELEHVKDYTQIQNYRFPERFRTEYEIPEELMEIKVMKFILQPIVENSISHGFRDRIRGGRIRILARLDKNGEELLLKVWDNGRGIEREKLEKINQRLFEYRGRMNEAEDVGADSIGVENVNARIFEYYGGESGVTLYSVYGKETTAVLRIKLCKGIGDGPEGECHEGFNCRR